LSLGIITARPVGFKRTFILADNFKIAYFLNLYHGQSSLGRKALACPGNDNQPLGSHGPVSVLNSDRYAEDRKHGLPVLLEAIGLKGGFGLLIIPHGLFYHQQPTV
jgi:hypothetical protein